MQFKPGDRVVYLPTHADGDVDHPDCEWGTVSSIGRVENVFVKFDQQVSKFGWEGATSQSCDERDLQH